MASNVKTQAATATGARVRSKGEKDSALTTQFRKAVIEKLDDWVATVPEPDEPLIGIAGGKVKPLTPRSIVRHVKKRTPTGEKLVANWADLVVRNIKGTPLV